MISYELQYVNQCWELAKIPYCFNYALSEKTAAVEQAVRDLMHRSGTVVLLVNSTVKNRQRQISNEIPNVPARAFAGRFPAHLLAPPLIEYENRRREIQCKAVELRMDERYIGGGQSVQKRVDEFLQEKYDALAANLGEKVSYALKRGTEIADAMIRKYEGWAEDDELHWLHFAESELDYPDLPAFMKQLELNEQMTKELHNAWTG